MRLMAEIQVELEINRRLFPRRSGSELFMRLWRGVPGKLPKIYLREFAEIQSHSRIAGYRQNSIERPDHEWSCRSNGNSASETVNCGAEGEPGAGPTLCELLQSPRQGSQA